MRQLVPINWLWRYRARNAMRDTLWILPILGMLAAMVTVRIVESIDRSFGWQSDVRPETALVVLGTMASSMFSFIVFLSSALLLSVQLASAQLTPRIIAFLFRDPVMKLALATFVFAFTFTVAVLVRIKDSVPMMAGTIASYAALASLCFFLYLLDHMGKILRANGALRSIGIRGRGVIESVYPRSIEAPNPLRTPADILTTEPTQTITSRREGAVLGFDTAGLICLGRRYDCIIEIVPQVGDFVTAGDPLFRTFQGGADLPDHLLRNSIAIGRERTFRQDPTFALRIIVDIAAKALSPAINDPTTAVLALDEIHHLLGTAGSRQLDDRAIRDAEGSYRLVHHAPNWADFVNLGVTEIRHYGSQSIQVTRKLRAMLENLIQRLSEDRAAPLRQELMLLKRSAVRAFAEPEDQALADVSDPQGVGGRHKMEAGKPADNGRHPAPAGEVAHP
jgi:uncharacterized membrane protein